MTTLLTVNFTAHNTVRGKRPYTIYEIEVRSSSVVPWLLYKRYSDFDVLHLALQRAIARERELSAIELPKLPPKRLVRSRSDKVVKERQRQLQEYLRILINKDRILRRPELLKFLEVPQTITAILQQRGGLGPRTHGDSSDEDSKESLSEFERAVNNFLSELSFQKHRVKAIGEFDSWFFGTKKRQSLKREEVAKLLKGDSKYPGLIYACRLGGHSSRVAWRSAMSLLAYLIDIERHEYARLFSQEFTRLVAENKSVLKEMELHKHAIDGGTDDDAAFRIIHCVVTGLPHLESDVASYLSPHVTTGSKSVALESGDVMSITNNGWVSYQRWLKRRKEARMPFAGIIDRNSSKSGDRSTTTTSSSTSSSSASSSSSSMISIDGGLDWYLLMNSGDGSSGSSGGGVGSSSSSDSMMMKRKKKEQKKKSTMSLLMNKTKMNELSKSMVNMIQTRMQSEMKKIGEWRTVLVPPAILVETTTNETIERIEGHISYKCCSDMIGQSVDSYQVLLECTLPSKISPLKVFTKMKECDLNTSMHSNNHWLMKIEESQSVACLTRNIEIIHERYKSMNSPFDFTIFRTLRTFVEIKKNEYFIGAVSVTNFNSHGTSADDKITAAVSASSPPTSPTGMGSSHSSTDLINDDSLALMLPSGVSIVKEKDGRTKVSVFLHLDGGCVSIVSADLLGECTDLFRSLVKLYRLCLE